MTYKYVFTKCILYCFTDIINKNCQTWAYFFLYFYEFFQENIPLRMIKVAPQRKV